MAEVYDHNPARQSYSFNQQDIPNYFPAFDGNSYIRPDPSDPKYNGKDELYHADMAKWAIFNSNEQKHTAWLHEIKRNKRFYFGDQWEGDEDLEAFLSDESGGQRSRIKVVINRFRSIVEQYRGNAIRLAIGASAKSISNKAKTRREESLKEALFNTDLSIEFKNIGEIMRKYDGLIGESPVETERNHDNLYVDSYIEKMNYLLRYCAEINDLEEQQLMVAQNMVFAGIGCIDEFEHGGHLRKEAFDAEEYFFDRNARRPDHNDAAYKGRVTKMNVPILFERWQGISQDERQAVRNYISTNSTVADVWSMDQSRTNIGNSVPVFKVYWRDEESKTYGWVEDQWGQPYQAVLNVPDELAEGKTYTEADLIDPPNTAENRRDYGNGKEITKKKRKSVVDVLRYAIMIPGESIGYRNPNDKKQFIDIMLEWGVYDYQETEWRDLWNVRYPLKTYCWSYLEGRIATPLSDAIDPQRLTNRIMSVIEGNINNSGGSNVFYDKDMVEDDEIAELELAIKNGDPVGIRTRGKGTPNTVTPYDNTPKAGTYGLFQVIDGMKNIIQETTGVNEAIKGESLGSDQLVGVTRSLIQQGTLMQEPIYNAIAKVFVQSHQHTATVGKRIYIDNQRELEIAVGMDGVEVFRLSEGMRNEDFRVFIKRDSDPESSQAQADGLLVTLLQMQMINKKFFVNHFNRSSIDSIMSDMRIQSKREDIAALQQLREQEAAARELTAAEAQRQAAAENAAAKAEQDAMVFGAAQDAANKEHELTKIALQGAVKNAGAAV